MKFKSLILLGLIVLLFGACSKSEITAPSLVKTDTVPIVKDPGAVPRASYDLSLLEKCTLFTDVPVTAVMERQDYNELSGIAESHKRPGILYVHEDKAGKAVIYLTNKQGTDLGKVLLDGCSPRDWEDITIGPGPEAGISYVYMADIGDNKAQNTSVFIYRFAEPDLSIVSAASEIHITSFDKIEVQYSKGAANAETLLIDPLTKDLFLATKENTKSYIYKIAYPQSLTSVTIVKPSLQLDFDLLTSGGISANGKEVLLRNKSQVWYWKRGEGEDIVSTLSRKPQDAPYAANEHQGEGICFAADGGGYFTDTEIRDYPGAVSMVSFYKRK
jgi:hypothetical protein